MKSDKIILEKIESEASEDGLIMDDIDNYWEILFDFLTDSYGVEYDKDTGDYFVKDEGNFNEEIANIVRKACLMLLLEKDSVSEKMINKVLRSNIEMLTVEILGGTDFALSIIEAYVDYVVKVEHYSIISSDYLGKIADKFPWLDEIGDTRGFRTINDMARDVLDCVYGYVTEEPISDLERHALYDRYFMTDAFDHFIESGAEPYSHSKEEIFLFKKYQIRIMFTDLYASLSIDKSEDENFSEAELLAFLEDEIYAGDFYLPTDPEARYKLLDAYFINMYVFKKEKARRVLEDNDKMKILSMGNPLYFID
ncbi:MAG TPA: hypothetical protein DCY94_03090 [Firmicutes bacterium]|nr:hypothetical protein [Bacillota bacterium]